MLNELENKIRKAIPELQYFENITNYELSKKNNVTLKFGLQLKPIQLNHVLEYVLSLGYDDTNNKYIIHYWNLKSNLLSDQSENIIEYLNNL